MKCPGLHCPGCNNNGDELVGLVALVLIVGGIIVAVLHAIWHTIIEVAEIVAWTVGSIMGAAAIAGGTYTALRIRRHVLERRARRPVPVRAEVIRLGEVTHGSINADVPALEAPHAASWPLPGWWQEIRPRVGHDDGRR